jgi:cation:H+ antiporter
MTVRSARTATALLPLFASLMVPVPWLVVRFGGLALTPPFVAVLTGLAILGAAFLLSWAAELLQIEVSQALALVVLALIAVLPEYAVDAVFTYQAGRDPLVAQQGYAVANMTGGNRLLIGLGWSSVVLLGLFIVYAWATTRAPTEEPELVGPAARLGQLHTPSRRAVTAGLFAYAAAAISLAAEPFAASLVETGSQLGMHELLLVQWLVPQASEAPEFVVALLFVWRGQAAAGISTLVSSKVNQWTILIATLPLVFSLGAGRIEGMPLVPRQQHELWLNQPSVSLRGYPRPGRCAWVAGRVRER